MSSFSSPPDFPEVFFSPPPPLPQRRVFPWLPLLLGLMTALCVVAAGGLQTQAGERLLVLLERGRFPSPGDFFSALISGIPYAVALMGFFLAHELGHFFACRWYRIDCTLPFFIPAPTFIGTFGAVIRIRGPIPHPKALFDIGIAGPLAGFAVGLPVMIWGVLRSEVIPGGPPAPGVAVFGDSLLTRILVWVLRGDVQGGGLAADPVFVAGWVGMLATAMNLFPAGQFDGGHVVYALVPSWHRVFSRCSIFFLWGLVISRLVFFGQWSAWGIWAIVLTFLGRSHPSLPWHGPPLGRGRLVLAFIGLLVFLLCFMPHPFEIVG